MKFTSWDLKSPSQTKNVDFLAQLILPLNFPGFEYFHLFYQNMRQFKISRGRAASVS